jgi:hypothetical protein
MEYSAVAASLTFGKALFVMPHLIGGSAALVAALKRKANPLVGVVGIVFVGAVGFALSNDTMESFSCRAAEVANRGEWVTGTIGSVRHTYSRGGDGTLHFTIGDRELSSRSSGINNDCGFIASFGKAGQPREGEMASALLHQGKVIKFTSTR